MPNLSSKLLYAMPTKSCLMPASVYMLYCASVYMLYCASKTTGIFHMKPETSAVSQDKNKQNKNKKTKTKTKKP